MILVVDFGSQTTHLIGRRIRDLGVKSELVLPQNTLASILKLKPKGIILSGGPASVYGKKALLIDKTIFNLGIPILGICYGLEVIGQVLGGKVKSGIKKEYGPTLIRLNNKYNSSNLFKNIPKKEFRVWMSHFDQVVRLPKNMINLGSTPTVRHAAFSNEKKKIFPLLFPPKVTNPHSEDQILTNLIL